ncbi:MAG: ATP-dependent DNA helicase RecG [Defluviitaleaceae bacterium]|nr:ATP-dependent DNA helicase RecG [Defluviitaleaceae bacterium]
MIKLTDPVTSLKNVGGKRAASLAKLGIRTVSDLVRHLPRKYLDRTKTTRPADLLPGSLVTLRATIASDPAYKPTGGRTSLTTVKLRDAGSESDITPGAIIEAVWFNVPFVRYALKKGRTYIFTGKAARGKSGALQLISPEFDEAGDTASLSHERIVPVYATTADLGQKTLRALIRQALDAVLDQTEDFLPNYVADSCALAGLVFALANIHFPADYDSFFKARHRLVFEELFVVQLALFFVKGHAKQPTELIISPADFSPALNLFPFELTDTQLSTLSQIQADFQSGYAANRLIQGDVGSGKTAVAMCAVYMAVSAGADYQAAVMTPTEVLAAQHFSTFAPFFEQLGVDTVLLTGKMRKSERDEALAKVADGTARIVIGTHALIQSKVEFARLTLVVTDEQHRFGVRQRLALSEKGRGVHTLVMSATPIPRTLALILYGDMDISVIDSMPPGRKPIKTYSVTAAYRPRLYKFIEKLVNEGQQAYVICPAIEESEHGGTSVLEYADTLRSALPGLRIAHLHGQMPQNDKNAVMQAFAGGGADVLVSTTVIEVGVNVPRATLMIVEDAERFGLSQLHQLRGRVGRGGDQSYCVLVSDTQGDVYKRRAAAMTATTDGFALSRLDLELRGPGDFFGTAQHGLPELTIANLYEDISVLEQAQAAARRILDSDPAMTAPCHAALYGRIQSFISNMSYQGVL